VAGCLGLSVSRAAVPLARERCDGKQTRVLIDHELEAADVAAIDLFRLRRIAVVPDFGLAGGALPRHG
jgi:hypothetical protein